ncbi:hypothetical protein MKX03_019979 [Papaver bracteatum]|nr:hypothetical protein MKX03_019979 [Papaver bracteatum]
MVVHIWVCRVPTFWYTYQLRKMNRSKISCSSWRQDPIHPALVVKWIPFPAISQFRQQPIHSKTSNIHSVMIITLYLITLKDGGVAGKSLLVITSQVPSILSPSRDKPLQIDQSPVTDHLKVASSLTNIRVVSIVGEIASKKQERLLKARPEIIVGTPGRLWEFMQGSDPRLVESTSFARTHSLSFFVLDEADRMIESGHFKEFQSIIDMLPMTAAPDEGQFENSQSCVTVSNIQRKKRQTFVFSATIALSSDFRKNIKGGSHKSKQSLNGEFSSIEKLSERAGMRADAAIFDLTNAAVMADILEESFIECREEDKDAYLYYLLSVHGKGRTIVFCWSIAALRCIYSLLLLLGINLWSFHSEMQQRARLKVQSGDGNPNFTSPPKYFAILLYKCDVLKWHSPIRTPSCLWLVCFMCFFICFTVFHEKVNKAWLERNAKSVELVVDEDDSEEERVNSHKQRKVTSSRLIKLQTELKSLLSRPLQPKSFSHRFLAGVIYIMKLLLVCCFNIGRYFSRFPCCMVSCFYIIIFYFSVWRFASIQHQFQELSAKKLGDNDNVGENRKRKIVVIGKDCIEPLQALRSGGHEVSMNVKEMWGSGRNIIENAKRKKREAKNRVREQKRRYKKRLKSRL